jgi:excinuclease UvrABC ATPase subunit
LVIPNKNLSVFEDAVACWRGETMSEWKKDFIKKAKDFPIHKPYHQLTKEQKNYLWRGEKNKISRILIISLKCWKKISIKFNRVMLSDTVEKQLALLAKENVFVLKRNM